MKNIVFNERIYSEENKEWNYYFTAPATLILKMFPGKYNIEEIFATEISIEIPCKNKTEYEFGNLEGIVVSVSPLLANKDGHTDYDWEDVDIPDSEVLNLLEKAMRQSFTFEEYWNSGLITLDLCVPGVCPVCDEISKCIAETTFDMLIGTEKNHNDYSEIKNHARQIFNRTCRCKHS